MKKLPRGNETLAAAARIQWKAAVNKGVSGTPCFLLNGVPVLPPLKSVAVASAAVGWGFRF